MTLDPERALRAAYARIDELEETIRQLREPAREEDLPIFDALGLSPTERRLLRALLARAPRRLSRSAILAAVWDGADVNEKVVDVYVCKVRRKIAPLGASIASAWGLGWSLGAADAERVRAAR